MKRVYLIVDEYSKVFATEQYFSNERLTALIAFSGGISPSNLTLTLIL